MSTFPLYFDLRMQERWENAISFGTGVGCTGVVSAGVPEVEYVIGFSSVKASFLDKCGDISISLIVGVKFCVSSGASRIHSCTPDISGSL